VGKENFSFPGFNQVEKIIVTPPLKVPKSRFHELPGNFFEPLRNEMTGSRAAQFAYLQL
jgi:hypothetical protein